MDPSPPNCNYETFTINVSSNVSSNNSTFKTLIVNPVKDVVEFSLIACSLPDTTSNVVYISVNEIDSVFNDYSNPVAGGGTPPNLRKCMGCIYKTFSGATADNRIVYRNEYPIKTRIIHPLERLSNLTISLFDDTGALIPSTTPGYYTFEIKCMRKNLCNFNRCN